MPCSLPSHSDPLTIEVQHERNRNEHNGQESQQRRCPSDANVVVHSSSKQWESSTETRSHEIVASENGGSVLGIRISKIVQDEVEQEEGTD